MKKQLTSLLFCTATVLWTNNVPAQEPPNDREAIKFREFKIWEDSLGTMAKCSDVIAIGTVLPGTPWTTPEDYWWNLKTYSIFRVEHPIWGCVSNQEFRVQISGRPPPPPDIEEFEIEDARDEHLYELMMLSIEHHDDRYPTNGSRIVLCVSTNNYELGNNWYNYAGNWNVLPEAVPTWRTWGTPEQPYPDGVPVFRRRYASPLSSWHDTPANQDLTAYLTNAVAALRTDRNWTNYYELCRSGMTNAKTHISKHAKADMINLFYSASDEQFQYMRNDPLLPDAFKNPYIDYLLANPRYRFPPWENEPPVP